MQAWRIRITQRRKAAARLTELEGLICNALETRNTTLDQVQDWLSDAGKLHRELNVYGFSLAEKKPFDNDDLIARLGTPEQRQASEQRQAEFRARKDADDRRSAQPYEIERLSHPKLAQPPKCVHPERTHCDYYDEFQRCEHMEFGGRPGFWLCNAGEKSTSQVTGQFAR